ncbi:Ig-like domain-containing protein [Geoalkalibacter halelectricus]|uniref:Ig-like domain-containing protein n=1 Tax=Geoalkalibacter halelectricus TaxID=2847045 RepID=A0ABY5ZN82_9BACT|nr:Ig-like domain-containing protein [Geoalkalibacter halelectricus]MDO3378361.1 Ig-like domain-containing protein [Geoalkalibacter halelectricus]UWZ80319.1 Ig-like domain-containing protein [Geoalkalibacter halelectricus]
MLKRLRFLFLVAVLGLAWAAATPVGAAVAPGPTVEPHGYPQFYTDATSLSLELCLENTTMCFFDPVIPGNEFSEANGFGPEAFWFLAEAEAATPPVPGRLDRPGRAILVLGLEAAFGADEAVQDGNQIAFGRIRVRIDVDQPGTYRVIHPYNDEDTALVFENVAAGRRTIDFTQDIGGVNPGNPGAAFSGAGASPITHFLTWPDYDDPDVHPQLRIPIMDDEGVEIGHEQYIGHPGTDHVVVGSPTENNFFRVERLVNETWELYTETDLFAVHGRVWSGNPGIEKTVYENVPEQRLLAVGPVNRDVGFNPVTPAAIAGFFPGYPLGYPLWYQEDDGTEDGLKLTLCPPGHDMCVSFPIIPTDPGSLALGIGDEAFWWTADAEINADVAADVTGTVPPGFDAELGLALEAAFGGDEAIEDGNQVGFGRVRIRIDVPNGYGGDYTIIHPYGVVTFENVPPGGRAINYTQDIGGVNPFDPDAAFDGALYSAIGPRFLTWTTFDLDAMIESTEEELHELVRIETFLDAEGDEVERRVYYVGDPAVAHEVTGGSFIEEFDEEVNYFRVIGPNDLDVRTDLFSVSGKVFFEDTFQVIVPDTIPVANPDFATTIGTVPVTINVLANDTLGGELIVPSLVTVELVSSPAVNQGDAVVNLDNTITFTAAQGFIGDATFSYRVVIDGTDPVIESDPALVTVTVLPEEDMAVTRARLDTRRMRWDLRGTGNATAEGVAFEVRQNAPDGTLIATGSVNNGRWTIRDTTDTAPPAGNVVIYLVTDRKDHGPFAVQVR